MQIFWIKLSKLKYKDFLNNLKNQILHWDKAEIVFTPNPEILLNTLKDKEFKDILQKADYLTIDWIGIYIWLQILNSPLPHFEGGIWKIVNIILLPYYIFNLFFRRKYLYEKFWERVCGSDLTNELVKFSEEKEIKITILDPYFPKDLKKVESQKTFKNDLQRVFPKLKFDYFIYKPKEKDDIIEKICNSNSRILFSTLWMKYQEKSVVDIMEKCKNLKLGLGVGSSFDYLIWFQKRAPKIFRILWLEWLYRLFTWPKKIKRLKRLYNAIIIFSLKVIFNKKNS